MNIEALHQVLDSEIYYFLEWSERPLKNHSIFHWKLILKWIKLNMSNFELKLPKKKIWYMLFSRVFY